MLSFGVCSFLAILPLLAEQNYRKVALHELSEFVVEPEANSTGEGFRSCRPRRCMSAMTQPSILMVDSQFRYCHSRSSRNSRMGLSCQESIAKGRG